MGKRVSATDMLAAGRFGPMSATAPDQTEDTATAALDDQVTSTPDDQVTSTPDAQTSERPVDLASRRHSVQSTSHRDAQTTSALSDQSPGQLDAEPAAPATSGDQTTSPPVAQARTYQRATVFLTPDQRRWLKETARHLPVDGLSASDVVRLALSRLRMAVDDGLPLTRELVTQAHAEAAVFTGRKNRGLPEGTGDEEVAAPRAR